MHDYEQSIYEYLFSSRELLEKGDLSDYEAEALKGKIEQLSALLGEK